MKTGTLFKEPETLQETFKRTFKVKIDEYSEQGHVQNGDETFLRELVEYIERNLSNANLSVEMISHEMKMSRVWLYKKILMFTGKSPIEFIRTIRLKKAVQLLENSDMKISQIANEVGIETSKHFSKLFKKEFDILPSTYVHFTRKTKAEAILNAYGLHTAIKMVSFSEEITANE